MPGEHAKLSASGSKRWLACPGSIVLEAQYPEEDSPYAAEGTRAHALAEITLRHLVLGRVLAEDVAEARAKADNDEMRRAVDDYVTYCKDLYDAMALKHKSAKAFVEERVSYAEWVPEGFGTVDFSVIGGGEMHIVDLKYGKGVPVDAVDNPQPRLYALGALHEYGFIYDIDTVTTHIVQPRLNSISTETLSVDELMSWTKDVKAKAAVAFNDTRAYQPGEHCKFCKARATCKHRAVDVLGAIVKILGGTNGRD